MTQEIKPEHKKEVKERRSPSGEIVYEAVLIEADEELSRKTSSLFWSGIAAGLSMGCSGLGVALLKTYLPDARWSPLIYHLGYSLGFLMVILGRQQLFTENTLTPILPLLIRWNVETLRNVLRLWLVIFVSNMIGALVVAYVLSSTTAIGPEVQQSLFALARRSFEPAFHTMVLRGVFAGWLIAMIVWVLPFAESARIWVIIILTYVVSLGGFPHIVAGATEVYGLAWSGQVGWWDVVERFVMPTLIGNIIGGVTLVAALNHAQVAGAKR